MSLKPKESDKVVDRVDRLCYVTVAELVTVLVFVVLFLAKTIGGTGQRVAADF